VDTIGNALSRSSISAADVYIASGYNVKSFIQLKDTTFAGVGATDGRIYTRPNLSSTSSWTLQPQTTGTPQFMSITQIDNEYFAGIGTNGRIYVSTVPTLNNSNMNVNWDDALTTPEPTTTPAPAITNPSLAQQIVDGVNRIFYNAIFVATNDRRDAPYYSLTRIPTITTVQQTAYNPYLRMVRSGQVWLTQDTWQWDSSYKVPMNPSMWEENKVIYYKSDLRYLAFEPTGYLYDSELYRLYKTIIDYINTWNSNITRNPGLTTSYLITPSQLLGPPYQTIYGP
jgi:hypothetical protein